ncbi:MAG TPA: Fur family transcriptional regulator [Thermoanaerobaculia bacterium]|nr:Fur family transcriptional regulator [Thermoanaerobaculia bacterium]
MWDSRAWAEERLREKGLRVTIPRVAVLSYLAGATHHPTADEIRAAVNRLVPTAARASIYNVLHSLRAARLVSEVVVNDDAVRYDANLGRHHHFVCTACGGVEDVPWAVVPPFPKRRLPGGQSVESVSVTLRGHCNACR